MGFELALFRSRGRIPANLRSEILKSAIPEEVGSFRDFLRFPGMASFRKYFERPDLVGSSEIGRVSRDGAKVAKVGMGSFGSF